MTKFFTSATCARWTPSSQTLGWAASFSVACVLGGMAPAQAQNTTTPPVVVTRTADFIVAVVNSEPITNHEVQQQRARMQAQWPAGTALPAPSD